MRKCQKLVIQSNYGNGVSNVSHILAGSEAGRRVGGLNSEADKT